MSKIYLLPRMIAALLVATLPRRMRAHTAQSTTSLRTEMRDGVRWLLRHGMLRDLAVALAVTMDDPAATEEVVRVARAERPDIPIIARARDATHTQRPQRFLQRRYTHLQPHYIPVRPVLLVLIELYQFLKFNSVEISKEIRLLWPIVFC